LGSVWFLFILNEDGVRFWAEYVTRETLSKMGGNNSSVPHMWADFSVLLFPFLILILGRLNHLFKRGPFQKFLWAWTVFPALFFSVFPYRTETYLFIVVPVFAFLVTEPGRKIWVRLNGLMVSLVFLVMGWVLLQSGMIHPLVWVGLIAVSLFFIYASFNRESLLAHSALALILFIRLSALNLGEKDIVGLRRAFAASNGPFAVYDPGKNIWNEVGVFSVALQKPLPRIVSEQELDQFLSQGGRVVMDEHQKKDFPKLKMETWSRWKRAFAVPSVQDLMSMKDPNSPEWKEKYLREFAIVYR
jgi:hypothetical protein